MFSNSSPFRQWTLLKLSDGSDDSHFGLISTLFSASTLALCEHQVTVILFPISVLAYDQAGILPAQAK